MHVLVAVDVIGRKAQALLEGLELALDFLGNLRGVDDAQQRADNKRVAPGQAAARRQRGMGPSGRSSVRLRCSPIARWPRCTRRRGAAAGQCCVVTMTLVADSRRAAASSPTARETPSVRA